MVIDLQVLARSLNPNNTILVFGAGSSIPSGAPSGTELCQLLREKFDIENAETLSLSDISTIIEQKYDRNSLINTIRENILNLQPTGGLLNLPLYYWAGIYTTNYDDLIEKSFRRKSKHLSVFSSNYDFSSSGIQYSQNLFKIHGTIEKDQIDGSNSRIILTGNDNDLAHEYREIIYAKLKENLFTHNAIIIGHSLNDSDLRQLIDKAQQIKSNSGAPGRVYIFSYEKNEHLALIYETRGFTVCFGGIDDFFSAVANAQPSSQFVLQITNDVLEISPEVIPCTISVSTARTNQSGQLEKMYNGRAASYADILQKWVFERDISAELESQIASLTDMPIAFILGSAGVGKTTAVRITLSRLIDRDFQCWEHKDDFELLPEAWNKIDNELSKRNEMGVLFIDDAHYHLNNINNLISKLTSKEKISLKIILVSSKPHWNPRLKTPNLFIYGKQYSMSILSDGELNHLLDLLESNSDIRMMVENTFLGFNRPQRLERLRERCNADMFVCLKNIFGYQSIDTILLEEYASLDNDYQEIYKIISGMESIGVRVHREMVRRVTGLEANSVSRTLDDLEGILEEYTVNEKLGIFGWKVRHTVISSIIAKYKYDTQESLFELFSLIVEKINPTYNLEVKSINDMCDLNSGIPRIIDKDKQNILLRKMISLAPGERVPRHRLIFNLIEQHQFDAAEREIRIFEKDLKTDGPLNRYKVKLKIGIARHTTGLLDEDRATLVREAASMAELGLSKFPDDKNIYRAYLEAGVAYFKFTKDSSLFEKGMQSAEEALERIMDPDLRHILSKYSGISKQMGIFNIS